MDGWQAPAAVTWNIWHPTAHWEGQSRMTASAQSVTGLQQNPF